MRKDRVWMKFKKEDFNQLMGVLSKQMERLVLRQEKGLIK